MNQITPVTFHGTRPPLHKKKRMRKKMVKSVEPLIKKLYEGLFMATGINSLRTEESQSEHKSNPESP